MTKKKTAITIRESFSLVQKVPLGKLLQHLGNDDHGKACAEAAGSYVSPKGYIDWDGYIKLCLAAGSARAITGSFEAGDAVGAVATTAVRSAIRNRAPAKYLNKEIAESFAQTPLPELPLEVLQVLPYLHLMLPRNSFFDCDGSEVVSIIIFSGKIFGDSIDAEQKLISQTFFPSENVVPDQMLGANGIQAVLFTPDGMDVFQEFISENAKSWHDENVKYNGRSKYAHKNTEVIMRIAINSLLVHLYEPELITTDKQAPTKAVGFCTSKKQPFPITWIGKTFTRRRESVQRGPSLSPKMSARAHWRRGHWHTVVCGHKRQQRRVQWFKPVYVQP